METDGQTNEARITDEFRSAVRKTMMVVLVVVEGVVALMMIMHFVAPL